MDYLLESRQAQSPVSSADRLACMRAIALRMFEDPEGVQKTLGRAEAATVVMPVLGMEADEAIDYLESETLQSGLLVSRTEGELEFWHLTFRSIWPRWRSSRVVTTGRVVSALGGQVP